MGSTLPTSLILAALLTLGASSLSAQGAPIPATGATGTESATLPALDVGTSSSQDTPALIAGPTLASSALTLLSTSRTFESVAAPTLAPSSRNTALMIVGVAGMVVGAVIGGDEGTIVMVGSGALGLYGLYQYLR